MKVLLCYRGKSVGKDLVNLAVQHAKAFSADVHIITSLQKGDSLSVEKIVKAEEAIENAKKILIEQGVNTEGHVLIRGNTAGEDIITYASENKFDEIIIGVKSRSKLSKVVFGSTAQFVILMAECPVVSVK